MNIDLLKHCVSDLDVANAARVSLDKWHDEWEHLTDGPLIDWLMRKHHGSPFEHGYFRFRVEAPIFVFREWHRHRAGHSYNEMSGRYTELEDRFYAPEEWRTQRGKPGAYTYEPLTDEALVRECDHILEDAWENAWWAYQTLLTSGVAKEQARAVLPLGIYSKMIWSCNPRSLMHFLALRNHLEAQAEIRYLAKQAEVVFAGIMPVTYSAFIDHGRICP